MHVHMVKVIHNSRGSSRLLARHAVLRIAATAAGAVHARLLQLAGRQSSGLCCRQMRALLLWHIHKSAGYATATCSQCWVRHIRRMRGIHLKDTAIYSGIVQHGKDLPRLWD